MSQTMASPPVPSPSAIEQEVASIAWHTDPDHRSVICQCNLRRGITVVASSVDHERAMATAWQQASELIAAILTCDATIAAGGVR